MYAVCNEVRKMHEKKLGREAAKPAKSGSRELRFMLRSAFV